MNHPEYKCVTQDHNTQSLLRGINPHLYLPKICTYLAQRTQFMCWLSENKNFCLWTIHTLTVLSSEAVTKDWPSLEKWTLLTVAVWALNTVDSPLLYRRKQHFKTAQRGSKDILYLKTQRFCMLSSAGETTCASYIRKKLLINPKQTHASWVWIWIHS